MEPEWPGLGLSAAGPRALPGGPEPGGDLICFFPAISFSFNANVGELSTIAQKMNTWNHGPQSKSYYDHWHSEQIDCAVEEIPNDTLMLSYRRHPRIWPRNNDSSDREVAGIPKSVSRAYFAHRADSRSSNVIKAAVSPVAAHSSDSGQKFRGNARTFHPHRSADAFARALAASRGAASSPAAATLWRPLAWSPYPAPPPHWFVAATLYPAYPELSLTLSCSSLTLSCARPARAVTVQPVPNSKK